MGAWIEIQRLKAIAPSLASHPTMGAWIEIKSGFTVAQQLKGRTPRWVRGLKYTVGNIYRLTPQSHPTMGAWIEIALH